MLNKVLKFLMYFVLRIYFRRVYLSNAELVPTDKPVILACNHTNAFMDALVVGGLLRKNRINFLTRSDVFNSAIKRLVLGSMYMLPIYRIQEGSENLSKNTDTFLRCNEVLKKNRTILIFSEGICVQEKRLRKLKKGTARIAFGAESAFDFNLDLHIVPVGINYTEHSKFRKELFVGIAEPFKAKDFSELYEKNPAQAINSFNEKLKSALKKVMIIIAQKENEKLIEQLFIIYRNNSRDVACNVSTYFPRISRSPDRLEMEKRIAESINLLKSEKLEALNKKVNDYFENLNKKNITDKSIAGVEKFGFLKYMMILLGFPFFVFGYLGNCIPLWGAKLLTDKIVKEIEFYASVNVGIGLILYLIYFFAIISIVCSIGNIISILLAVLLPVCGYFSLFYSEIFKDWLKTIRFQIEKRKNPLFVEELKKMRGEIIAQKDCGDVN